MDLTNRELATLVWIALACAALLAWPKTRLSLLDAGGGMLSSLASPELAVALGGYVLWVEACLAVGRLVGIWDYSLAKDAVGWFLFGGLPLFAGFANFDEARVLRKGLLRTIAVPELVAFLFGIVSLPFLVEFLALPVLALASAMVAYAAYHDDAAEAAGLFQGMAVIVVVALAGLTLWQLLGTWQTLDGQHLVFAFYLPLWLTAGAFPYVAFLRRHSRLEMARARETP